MNRDISLNPEVKENNPVKTIQLLLQFLMSNVLSILCKMLNMFVLALSDKFTINATICSSVHL